MMMYRMSSFSSSSMLSIKGGITTKTTTKTRGRLLLLRTVTQQQQQQYHYYHHSCFCNNSKRRFGNNNTTTTTTTTNYRCFSTAAATPNFRKFCYDIIPIEEESMNHNNDDNDDDYDNRIASYMKPYYKKQIPFVIRNAVINTPAIKLWSSLDYLNEKICNNTNTNDNNTNDNMAYVEIGGSYTNLDTPIQRPEIPFNQYIQYIKLFHDKYGRYGSKYDTQFIIPSSLSLSDDDEEETKKQHEEEQEHLEQPSNDELVYMAQNDIFPILLNDIRIPKFIEDEEKTYYNIGNHGKLYNTMLWFGPRNCISPLHYDPLDNILLQFVGRKRILLFPPTTSTTTTNDSSSSNNNTNTNTTNWHYSGMNGQQYNTSPINIEDNNPISSIKKQYPNFYNNPNKSLPPKAIYCMLYPGDFIYIPSKWWHHVRSFDTSISVNTWWR